MGNKDKIGEAFGKSILWNFATAFFSLLQLIALFLAKKATGVPWDHNKIIQDCVILFFCSTIVSASMVEYFFMEKEEHPIQRYKLLELFTMILLPIVLVFISTSIYCSVNTSSIDVKFVEQVTYACLICSIIYCLLLYTYIFYNMKPISSPKIEDKEERVKTENRKKRVKNKGGLTFSPDKKI